MPILYIAIPVLLLLVGWMLLIAPSNKKEMESFKKIRYAHRGLHGEADGVFAAENSMTAFARAADAGFGIELDVRASNDGVLMVFHDATLDRVTGVTGKVGDKTADELRALSLLGTSDGVPTFADVLELVDGRVPLLVEIKPEGAGQLAAELTAEALASYSGPYIVESFNPLALGVIKKKLPGAMRGFLSDKLTANEKYRSFKHRIAQRCLLNFIARPAFISANKDRIRLFPLPIIRHLFRTPFIAWTVKSAEEERAAYENGFDGVIFEDYIPGETEK